MRQWPVDGVVSENGAVAAIREGRGVRRIEYCTEEERHVRRIRLAKLVSDVRDAVPEARLSDDVEARRSDVTWDVGERVRLPQDRISIIVERAREVGARTTQSSVHLHATFDEFDKASGSVEFLRQQFQDDAGSLVHAYAFVGDSGNDAPCFAAFSLTFGVANVRPALSNLSVVPRFVASSERGAGFREIAQALVDGVPARDPRANS